MSVIRKLGRFFGKVIRKVGNVGGTILKGVGAVKNFADQSGITSALTAALMSNPYTAGAAPALALTNPAIKAAQGLTGAMSKVGG